MWKRQVERALATRTVARLARGRVRGKTLVLAYHGIVPRGESNAAGERALFVAQERFGEQLDAIAERADVVPLAALDGTGDRPRVAITFDDAYHGAVTCGLDELRARNLPATIFVAPGCVDGHVFWWDALAHGAASLNAEARQYALEALCGDGERVRAWARERGLAFRDDLPAHARAAPLGALDAAARIAGVTFGSHTWSHINLEASASDAVQNELERSGTWVNERFGDRAIPWLAYPYGLASADARERARRTGYASALRITGSWHRRSDVDPFWRPRMNVGSGMTTNGLRARLAGVL
jgi:peptidoglycan/xylan/chitin deacetylase (PgdA/CDA1 family)